MAHAQGRPGTGRGGDAGVGAHGHLRDGAGQVQRRRGQLPHRHRLERRRRQPQTTSAQPCRWWVRAARRARTYDNLDYSGAATDSTPNFSSAYLVGAIHKNASGRPQNGTYTFAGGADGAPNALSYTGTAGTGNSGIAALEGDQSVRHVFSDDPGAATRQAVNAALLQHVQAMGDRCAYINGNQGQTLQQVASDVSNYRSARVVYVDPRVYVLDDAAGALHLVPGASFAASAAAQLSPSTSIAWKDPEVIAMLSGIQDLEFDRGNGAADNTDQGVATLIREDNGGFTFEAGVLTVAPLDPARRNHTRTRMGDYAAVSMVRSSRSFIDAPNVPSNQQAVVHMVQSFMEKLVAAQNSDPNHTPHCLAYDIPPLATFNAQDDLDNGMLTVPVDMKTSSGIEKLFFSMLFGETVQVSDVMRVRAEDDPAGTRARAPPAGSSRRGSWGRALRRRIEPRPPPGW